MRNKLFLCGGIILLAVVLFVVFASAKHMSPTLSIGGHVIQLELADTEAKRILGLGGREVIGDDESMLFVFPKSDKYGIWMKGMRFPLDIVWLEDGQKDAGGKQMLVVLEIQENIAPETYPEIFYPREKALYVLEMKGGSAQKSDMHVGSILTLKK